MSQAAQWLLPVVLFIGTVLFFVVQSVMTASDLSGAHKFVIVLITIVGTLALLGLIVIAGIRGRAEDQQKGEDRDSSEGRS